jgi:hypothetical protein
MRANCDYWDDDIRQDQEAFSSRLGSNDVPEQQSNSREAHEAGAASASSDGEIGTSG